MTENIEAWGKYREKGRLGFSTGKYL